MAQSLPVRWTDYELRGRRQSTAVPLSVGVRLPGTPILVQQFGGSVWLAVEIAWGANLSQPAESWTWTDVTQDVKAAQKVVITVGRTDESSTPQPASCKFTLDNRSGAYTKGGQSPNWPNVRRGTAIRVRIFRNGTPHTRFLGYAAGFTPTWDTTGIHALVNVTAAGIKRRLSQQRSPLRSVMTRDLPVQPNMIAYWPCEDGTTATQLAPGLPGVGPLQIQGTPNLASYTSIPATNAVPTFNTDSWGSVLPSYVDSGGIGVAFLLVTPTAGFADGTRIVSLFTLGSIARVDLQYGGTPTAGALRIVAFDQYGNTVYNSGNQGFSAAGVQFYMAIQWTQTGGNITFAASALNYVLGSVGGFTGTPVAGSVTRVNAITMAPDKNLQGVACGQIFIRNAVTPQNLSPILKGFVGEYTGTRLDRLASENGEFLNRTSGTTHQFMGAQSPDTLLNLLESCAKAEQGLLYDGLAQGLSFVSHQERTNRPVDLTLDASLGQTVDPLAPVDDDLGTVNTYTATRQNGSTFTYSDTTSSMSVPAIGEYPGSDTVNVQFDGEQVSDFAGWQVHVGTQDAYRYPQNGFLLHRDPGLLDAWLACPLWARVDITNASQVRTQMNRATISQLVEGWTETIDQFTWTVGMNTSNYQPYRVGLYAAPTGDTGEFVMRLQGSASTVQTGCPAGGTSITVATSSGPVWTTTADDFPVLCDIAGNIITVTNITGSGPQTFTLNPVPVAIPAGVAVTVHASSTLGVVEL